MPSALPLPSVLSLWHMQPHLDMEAIWLILRACTMLLFSGE